MTSICEVCNEARSVTGQCSCDVDGVPPIAYCVWRSPESLEWVDPPPTPAEVALPAELVARRPDLLVRPDRVVAQWADVEPVVSGLCGCGRPAAGFICPACVEQLRATLLRVPTVLAALEARLTASVRGIDYASWSEPAGPSRSEPGDRGAAPTSLPFLPEAADARAALIAYVRWVAARCVHARIDLPAGALPATLAKRVDAMALHPAFWSTPRWLLELVGDAERSVSHLTGREGTPLAAVADQLMHRAYTASEIATIAIDLGQVGLDGLTKTEAHTRFRKRIDQWHHRKRIEHVDDDPEGRPRFRFGEVHLLLLRAPSTPPATPAETTHPRPGLDGLASWPTNPEET